MAILGRARQTAGMIFSANREDMWAQTSGEVSFSPLDARMPDVSLQEMRETGKSAARLRVEKGVGSFVDHIEVKLETHLRGGTERQ